METLKRGIEFAFSPLGILVLLLAGGLLLGLRRRYARAASRMLASGAFLFLALVFSPLAEVLTWGLERHFPPLQVPPAGAGIGTIVVLAGYGERHPGFPPTSALSEETVCRLSEGIRLFRLMPGARLVVSGGVVRDGDGPIAGLMAAFLHQAGIPEEAVVVEGNSRNTYENLVEVRKITGSSPFILVTSACDLRRASAVARKLGMNPLPAPACIWALQDFPEGMGVGGWFRAVIGGFARPSFSRLSRLQWAYHEYLGHLWYRLLGRV